MTIVFIATQVITLLVLVGAALYLRENNKLIDGLQRQIAKSGRTAPVTGGQSATLAAEPMATIIPPRLGADDIQVSIDTSGAAIANALERMIETDTGTQYTSSAKTTATKKKPKSDYALRMEALRRAQTAALAGRPQALQRIFNSWPKSIQQSVSAEMISKATGVTDLLNGYEKRAIGAYRLTGTVEGAAKRLHIAPGTVYDYLKLSQRKVGTQSFDELAEVVPL